MNSNPDIVPLVFALLSCALPFISFVGLFALKEKLAEPYRGKVATLLLLLSFIASLSSLVYIGIDAREEYSMSWFSYVSGGKNITFSCNILLNGMSLVMLNIVTFISFLVHLYSVEYMHHKRNHAVYYPYLGLFTASMAVLVISNNILITFMAWELVGFSSYLLVGFWFDKEAASQAASKAFLMNRVADLAFLLALLMLFVEVGSFDLHQIELAYTSLSVSSSQVFWIGLLFFIGCMAKTAQFPLNSWLPDAMEGPTPVSGLLHAATMVAAGVFLLVKMEYLLNEDVRLVMVIVGSFTAFFGALPAITSFDSKKILAFSTVSQLGYMIATIGCSEPGAAYFHLITHAFFKAGLFLSVGVVIHVLHEIQVNLSKEDRFTSFDTMDLRSMGGMGKRLPWVMYAYLITGASLIGLPLFSGFLSKESMLNAMLNMAIKYEGVFWVVPVLGFITVMVTAYYITRQGILIFCGESKLLTIQGYRDTVWAKIHANKSVLLVPLLLLSLGSLFIVFSINPFSAHHAWIYRLSGLPVSHSLDHVWVLILSLSLVSIGAVWSYRKHTNLNVFEENQPTFLSKIWGHFYYLDKITATFVVTPVLKGSMLVARFDKQGLDGLVHLVVYATVLKAQVFAWFDKTFVDGVISSAVYFTGRVGKLFRVFQKGNVQNYLFWTLWVMLLIAGWIIIQLYIW